MSDLSGRLQQLWSQVELARTNQSEESLGRYDVCSYNILLVT